MYMQFIHAAYIAKFTLYDGFPSGMFEWGGLKEVRGLGVIPQENKIIVLKMAYITEITEKTIIFFAGAE